MKPFWWLGLFAHGDVFAIIVLCVMPVGSEKKQECGVAKNQTTGRIVGGTVVDITLHPWLVMVVHNQDLLCAGALLNSRFFITAAHCFTSRTKTTELKAFLGANRNPPQLDFADAYQVSNISKIIQHPHYNPSKLENDISIVRLQTNIVINSRVFPICLPPPDLVLDEQNAVLAGWGDTTEDGYQSDYLQEISLPIASYEECVYVLQHPFLKRTNICAGHLLGGRDACQGDSGSPLIWARNNTWIVVGLVSWGEGCGRIGVYGVYTRVSSYVNWINSLIDLENDTQDFLNENGILIESKIVVGNSSNATSEIESVFNKGCENLDNNYCKNTQRKSRIVGGSVAPSDKYPWMLAVVEVCGINCLKFLCAAIAIGCRWAITAAACVSNGKLQSLRVVHGVYDLNILSGGANQLTKIQKLVLTPNKVKHNLALIKTSDNLLFSACLPPISLTAETFTQGKLIAVGWGRTSTDGRFSSALKEVELPIVSNQKCKKLFPSAVHKGILCAGGFVNESICHGDFGGPLLWVNPDDGVQYVVGVASFISPNGCAIGGVPVGFTRLTKYMTWLIGAVQKEK